MDDTKTLSSLTIKYSTEDSCKNEAAMSKESIGHLDFICKLASYGGFKNKIQEIYFSDVNVYDKSIDKDYEDEKEDGRNFGRVEDYLIQLINKITSVEGYKIKSLKVKGSKNQMGESNGGISNDLLDAILSNLGRLIVTANIIYYTLCFRIKIILIILNIVGSRLCKLEFIDIDFTKDGKIELLSRHF